jgi:hypothetical protein
LFSVSPANDLFVTDPSSRLSPSPSLSNQITAGTVGYCVGNLRIAGYALPWESAAGTWSDAGNKSHQQ